VGDGFGFFLWSGATAVTGGLHAFGALLAARLMLGMGESVAYPCYARTLVRHVPEVGRGFANALIAAGVGCGPALGTFFGGTLMARYGWRPFFIVLGIVSMAWLIPWFLWVPRAGTAISHVEKGSDWFLKLVRQRSLWGTCGGLFGANYVLYFEITWLPNVSCARAPSFAGHNGENRRRGILCYSAGAVLFGWLSDRWIAAGGTPTLVRKTFAGIGAGSAGLLLLGCAPRGPTASVILLLLAFGAGGMCGSNIWGDYTNHRRPKDGGPLDRIAESSGKSCRHHCAGGDRFVIDYTGRFIVAFVIMAVVAMLAALSYFFVIGPVKENRLEQ